MVLEGMVPSGQTIKTHLATVPKCDRSCGAKGLEIAEDGKDVGSRIPTASSGGNHTSKVSVTE